MGPGEGPNDRVSVRESGPEVQRMRTKAPDATGLAVHATGTMRSGVKRDGDDALGREATTATMRSGVKRDGDAGLGREARRRRGTRGEFSPSATPPQVPRDPDRGTKCAHYAGARDLVVASQLNLKLNSGSAPL
jgi:hypothetical protein